MNKLKSALTLECKSSGALLSQMLSSSLLFFLLSWKSAELWAQWKLDSNWEAFVLPHGFPLPDHSQTCQTILQDSFPIPYSVQRIWWHTDLVPQTFFKGLHVYLKLLFKSHPILIYLLPKVSEQRCGQAIALSPISTWSGLCHCLLWLR